MGAFDFEGPVGANADVMELEYITALHQTDDADHEAFTNASIGSSDVKYYLLSRYGIVTTEEVIRNLIFRGLAGGDGEDDCIDIAEIVTILLIPFFSKITDHSNEAENLDNFSEGDEEHKTIRFENIQEIISDILNIILQETTGSPEPRPLTKELLNAIFTQYDELDIQNDDTLVDEMIKLATRGEDNVMLNSETFARALSDDIKLYNPTNESRKSTHYEDAFGINGENVDGVDIDSIENMEKRDFQRVFNFPQLDILADTYRSKAQFILALMALFLTLVTYVYHTNVNHPKFISVCPAERRETYSCAIGLSIVTWMFHVVGAICIGIPFITLLNLGNDLHHAPVWERIGGLLAAVMLVILPGWVKPYYISFSIVRPIGYLLVFIQVSSIIESYYPHDIKWLSFLRSSAVRNEVDLKLAAATKVHKMVQNAYTLHKAKDNSVILSRMEGNDTITPSHAVALLNFTEQSDLTETSGGFFWCWKQFYSGSLLAKEGIWIHTRILAANLVQICIVVVVVISTSLLLNLTTAGLTVVEEITYATIPNYLDENCVSRFDYNKCAFPEISSNKSMGIAICPVSYSNGCNFTEVVNSGIKEQYCDTFDAFVKVWNSDGLTSCPSLVTSSSKPLYSYTHDSIESAYCGGALSICVSLNSGENVTGLCLIGLKKRTFLPYQFGGTSCSSIPKIAKLIDDNPVGDEEIDNLTSVLPEKWMVHISFIFGIIAAIIVGTYNTAVNVPSIVITTLQFRSGVLPSLRDIEFKKYRASMFNTATLIGASVWGSIVMFFFIIFFSGGPILFLVYPRTNVYILKFLPTIIGIIVVAVFRSLATELLAKYSFAGFYRKSPVLCNIVTIGLETLNFLLSSLVVITRAAKIMFITFVFLGRFDRPFLADEISKIGPVGTSCTL